ncbi:MAG TPA: prolyl oligopeptidase family serine peptidase, partial [Candidatus Bathyarchaeia archaeon]|nr:prolyl oligopeptidase family serine peptidase [Candidatus Bathyarchaeia archaeon]
SEQRVYEDIRAMWRFLVEQKKVAPERIVIWGRSVGGGAASQLASEVEPGAIVLESTFSSAVNLASEVYSILPVRLLMKHRFENIKKVPLFKAPLMVIHSRSDTLIPQHHGKALFDAAHEPRQFVETRGDHNDALFASWDTYKKALNEFLGSLFPMP